MQQNFGETDKTYPQLNTNTYIYYFVNFDNIEATLKLLFFTQFAVYFALGRQFLESQQQFALLKTLRI